MLKVEGVLEAHADMNAHEVTVTLSGPEVELSAVIRALNDAGYTVGTPKEVKEGSP